MRNTLTAISFVCWLAVVLNAVAGFLAAPLWRDNSLLLWSALIFALWAVAEAVMDAAEFVKGEGEG